MYVFDFLKAYWGRRTKLQLKSHEDYIEYNLNYPYREVPGEKTDLGAGNPVYSGDLSQQQLQTCVSLKYRIMGIKMAKFSVLLRCFFVFACVFFFWGMVLTEDRGKEIYDDSSQTSSNVWVQENSLFHHHLWFKVNLPSQPVKAFPFSSIVFS